MAKTKTEFQVVKWHCKKCNVTHNALECVIKVWCPKGHPMKRKEPDANAPIR